MSEREGLRTRETGRRERGTSARGAGEAQQERRSRRGAAGEAQQRRSRGAAEAQEE